MTCESLVSGIFPTNFVLFQRHPLLYMKPLLTWNGREIPASSPDRRLEGGWCVDRERHSLSRKLGSMEESRRPLT